MYCTRYVWAGMNKNLQEEDGHLKKHEGGEEVKLTTMRRDRGRSAETRARSRKNVCLRRPPITLIRRLGSSTHFSRPIPTPHHMNLRPVDKMNQVSVLWTGD